MTTAKTVVPRRAGPGRVRRLQGGRHQQVRVRVSDEELGQLQRMAAEAGVSVQRLVLEQLLVGGRPTVSARRRATDEFLGMQRQLVGLATNVNQLARVGNSSGVVPAGTAEALSAISRLEIQVATVLEQLASTWDLVP